MDVTTAFLNGNLEEEIYMKQPDLGKQFTLKDMDELLGVGVKQNLEKGKVWIGQQAYTKAVLEKFGMEHSKPAKTPLASGTKLLKATEQSEMVDAALYQSAVGGLLYISGWTRPDIAFSVSNVARFCSNPMKEH